MYKRQGLHDASFWVMIAFIFVFLMLFNKVVPNLHLRFREVWPGALFSLVAWILVSLGFSFYVDNMARYSVLYGSCLLYTSSAFHQYAAARGYRACICNQTGAASDG